MYFQTQFLSGLALFFAFGSCVEAITIIDLASRYAYAANFGWIDWVADTTNLPVSEYRVEAI
jgi:hypothetical protein